MSAPQNAGIVTAYGAAVRGGYQGTYEEFCAAMADLGVQVEYLEDMTVTVQMLDPDASPAASYANGTLTLQIPRGQKGDKGDKGNTGNTGATGATPNLTIGIVTTGAAGTDAAATITGTPESPVLNLTIPKGADGEVPAAAIAPTESTLTASRAYAVGERFWYSGTLYIATAPIASGGAIVISGSGANVKTDDIGADLTAQSVSFQNMIEDTAEASTVASAAHEIGTFFRLSGELYKATRPISIGDTFTNGTNCMKVNIGKELELEEESDLFLTTFKDYLIYGNAGDSSRRLYIEGNKVTSITGSGSTYYCWSILSKDHTLRRGTGTVSGIQTFLTTYKNYVFIPISKLGVTTNHIVNFIVKYKKLTVGTAKTLFRVYGAKGTESNGEISLTSSPVVITSLNDNLLNEPYPLTSFSADTANNYDFFAVIVCSNLPDAGQQINIGLQKSRIEPYSKYITPYSFSTYKATTAVPINNLVMVGNQLYKSTAAIANNENLIEGTNIEKETLNSLNAKIPSPPSDDGEYRLTVTVSDGTPTYSWESAT